MPRKANYHELQALPAYTAPQWGPDKQLQNDADPYKWSGSKAPPAIGATVQVHMNQFGKGTVVGYFAEYGWLGVLVKIRKPPLWWKRQMKDQGKNPATTNGHFFGLDLECHTPA
jgi:hypothetical protein